MTTATKTILWIGIPTVVVTGILIWLIKKDKNKPDPNGPGKKADATGPTAPTPKPAPAPSNTAFPLQKGSKSDYVKQLQSALKITADGIFGINTETALSNAAGVTMVKDQTELNAIIKKVNASTASIATTARADELLNKFNAGGYAIQGITTSNWTGIKEDAYGALQPTGYVIPIYKGTTYNNGSFKLVKVTKLGKIVIEITGGVSKGLWSGDPNNITLVAYTPPPATSFNDQTFGVD